jgi:hypothetical protein
MPKFKVVKAGTPAELEQKVNELLDQGYIITGGLNVFMVGNNPDYAQGMILYDQPTVRMGEPTVALL